MKKDFSDTYNEAMLEEDERYGDLKQKRYQYYMNIMKQASKEVKNEWNEIQDKFYNGEIDARELGKERIRLFGDWKK